MEDAAFDLTMSIAEIKGNAELYELSSDEYPFSLALRVTSFENESEYMKFVKNCEKLIRNSLEYRDWRNYIVEVLKVNTCALTEENIDECSIHIHHHIFSLHQIVKAVINKKLQNEEPFCSFDICTEVIELHYKNYVGFIPLVETLHEKLHNGHLEIPMKLVYGDYKSLMEEYLKYLDDGDVENIMKKLSINEDNATSVNWKKNNYPGIEETKECQLK